MHAWQFRYPEFKEGQVLSHNDLNLLRDFLYSRTTAQARMLIGFGVACGLRGTVAGGTLQIAPGIALGQGGRELLVETQRNTTITSLAAATLATYTGVSGTDGYTAIHREADAVEPSGGECDEDGCTTHTEIHTLATELVWARGRLGLTGPMADAIFDLAALPPGATATAFNTLRNALSTRLTGILEAATLDILRGYSLESGAAAAGRNLIRIGIVNEVLYTAWAYFRCQAQIALSCLGVAADDPQHAGRPGVALGWLHQTGSAWTFDHRYRHDFQLSRALYTAFAGGAVDCAQHLDHMRVLLQQVEVPAPPTGGGTTPPDAGSIDICKAVDWANGRCGTWWNKDLRDRLPYDVFMIDPSKVRGPHGPYPPEDPGWGTRLIDEISQVDVLNVGLVRTSQFVNTRGDTAKANLTTAITALGLEAKVDVMPVAQLSSTPGFQAGLVVSAGDRIVMGVNTAGAVVSMGSVPTQSALADVTAVPGIATEARATAQLAMNRVLELEPLARDASLDATTLLRQFDGLKLEWNQFKLGMPSETLLDQAGQIAKDVGRLDTRTAQFQRTLDRMQTQLDSKIRKVEVDAKSQIERLRAHVNNADTEITGMVRENRHRVERQRVAVDRMDKETTTVRERVDEIGRATNDRIAEFGNRMDTQAIAIRTGMTIGDATRAKATNESLLGALNALATAAQAAATTGAQKSRVNKLLAQTETHFETLRSGTASPVTLTESAPDAVLGALEGIVGVLEAAGVTGTELENAQAALAGVRRNIEVG
ncbi:MAG: hypothetical protein ACXWYO_07070 [Gaiellaceae bacterium]